MFLKKCVFIIKFLHELITAFLAYIEVVNWSKLSECKKLLTNC